MKNTKNLLITGIVLATALFASVQVTAMASRVNPNLTPGAKRALERHIGAQTQQLDPKSGFVYTPEELKEAQQKLKRFEKMYYGNEAYDEADVRYAAFYQ